MKKLFGIFALAAVLFAQTTFITHIMPSGLATLAGGAGAGTGATVVCVAGATCTDLSGAVLITTAGTPSANAVFFTLTFGTPYVPTVLAPPCTFYPQNSVSSLLAGVYGPQPVNTAGVVTATLVSGATGLVTATAYQFAYRCF
jgi:hypothetical protein